MNNFEENLPVFQCSMTNYGYLRPVQGRVRQPCKPLVSSPWGLDWLFTSSSSSAFACALQKLFLTASRSRFWIPFQILFQVIRYSVLDSWNIIAVVVVFLVVMWQTDPNALQKNGYWANESPPVRRDRRHLFLFEFISEPFFLYTVCSLYGHCFYFYNWARDNRSRSRLVWPSSNIKKITRGDSDKNAFQPIGIEENKIQTDWVDFS